MSEIKTAVSTKHAPSPRAGIYNQAIIANCVVYTSDFTPVDPATGRLVEGSISDRARQCITNVAAVLDAAGTNINNAVKVTVYLTDMGNFDEVNEIYSKYWGDIKPCRSCVAVRSLPRGTDIEIDCIAVLAA